MGKPLAVCPAHSRCSFLYHYSTEKRQSHFQGAKCLLAQGLTHLAPGSCSAHPTAACPDVIILNWENAFLNGRSLRYRSLLVVCGRSNPPHILCLPWPKMSVECKVLWNARSLAPAGTLLSLLWQFVAHTFSEFEMASDLHEICHPIARWFKSLQPRTPWKYL